MNRDDRGIASFGEHCKGAWVRDPDGNVLGLFERP
jgi:hypothetical protein